jgi:predicted site-specific integrase-resolvase
LPIVEDNEIYLSVREACAELGISRQSLNGYAKRGLLKKYSRTLARRVFYKKTEIDNLMKIGGGEETAGKDAA